MSFSNKNSINRIVFFLGCTLPMLALCQTSPAQSVPSKPAAPAEVAEQYKQVREQIKWQTRQLERFVEALARKEKDLNVQQSKLNDLKEKHDQLGVSDESFASVMKDLHIQRVQLKIELAGLAAKRRELKEQIHVWRTEKSKQKHLVVQRLEDLLELQKSQLARLEKLAAQGVVPQKEKQDWQMKILDTEIRIAQQKSDSEAHQAGNLGEQMTQLNLELAEKSAQLDEVDQLLNRFAPLRADFTKIGNLERRAEEAQKRHLNSMNQVKRAQSALGDLSEQKQLLESQYRFDL